MSKDTRLVINERISETKKLIELWLGKDTLDLLNIFMYEGKCVAVTDYFWYKENNKQIDNIDKVIKLIYVFEKFGFEQTKEWILDGRIEMIISLLNKIKV